MRDDRVTDHQVEGAGRLWQGGGIGLLDAPVSHRCSMGRGLRGLLVHNLEHERMHLGQVATQRYYLHEMQLATMSRLLAEWYRERANLISLLIGLPDEALDARSDREEWTIR
ncbi:MAG TPA: hypothetical protein VFB73_06830 [Chloroflexota bacterium]|nr:hypothetical protein [Chloroflexota bacterium]